MPIYTSHIITTHGVWFPFPYGALGEFCEGTRHGQGIIRTPSYTYEGSWAYHHMHGHGKFTTGDGGVYTGHFLRGKRFLRKIGTFVNDAIPHAFKEQRAALLTEQRSLVSSPIFFLSWP